MCCIKKMISVGISNFRNWYFCKDDKGHQRACTFIVLNASFYDKHALVSVFK